MLLTVILEREIERLVDQFDAATDVAARVTQLQIDPRFWEAGKHHEESEPCLHRRVDLRPDQPRRLTRAPRARTAVRLRAVHEVLRQNPSPAGQAVTEDHQIDQRQLRGELEEATDGAGRRMAFAHEDITRLSRRAVPGAHVGGDTSATVAAASHAADMHGGVTGHPQIP